MLKKTKIPCPFCNKEIDILFEETGYRPSTSHSASAGTKTSYVFKPERSEAFSDCSNCGKTKKDIQKALNGNTQTKPKSKEDLKKQLEELGLTGKL